jgi:hypothetical protein
VLISAREKRGVRDAGRHAPVVVLSPPRSFSSVVTAMLGQHPELYGFPELGIFAAEKAGGSMAVHGGRGVRGDGMARKRPGLAQAVAELGWGAQGPGELAQARAWLAARQALDMVDVYDALLDQIAPLRGVEKTPTTLLQAGALDRATDAYPRACFLHLTRHPRTALRSLEEQFLHWRSVGLPGARPGRARGRATAPAPGAPPWPGASGTAHRRALRVHCAAIWLVAHRRALAHAGRLPAARVLRVHGEDLLTGEPGCLARVARWLGIRGDSRALAQMRHPERSPYAHPVAQNQPGSLDRKFLADPVLRPPAPPPAGAEVVPDGWELAEELVSRIRATAAELGYGRAA